MTCFDDLNTELLYEIFDYLSFTDLYRAFFHLNERLNSAIQAYPTCFNLGREIHLRALEFGTFTCRALVISGDSLQQSNMYLKHFNFKPLRALSSIYINFKRLKLLFGHFPLQQIESIRIDYPHKRHEHDDSDYYSIMTNAFQFDLPALRYAAFKHASAVEILLFVRHTLNVCSLIADIEHWNHDDFHTDFRLSKLTHLDLYIRGCYSFRKLQEFLSVCTFVNDCTLRFWVTQKHAHMIDSEKWQHLIDTCLPNLHYFKLRFYRYTVCMYGIEEERAIEKLQRWAKNCVNFDIKVRYIVIFDSMSEVQKLK